MAEAALYHYTDDPEFPFEQVRDLVSWIPQFFHRVIPNCSKDLSEAEVRRNLLNILLVFTRSRASTLIFLNTSRPPMYKILKSFVNQLNSVLNLVPNGKGKPHLLEIVRYNARVWFVTSRYSLRFIRKQKLNHREIGLNLDLYAVGHVAWPSQIPEGVPRGTSSFVELTGSAHWGIIAESVFPDYLDKSAFQDFNERKENLFNSSMNGLGLPYRFKWLWDPEYIEQQVKETMENCQPPPQIWWTKTTVSSMRNRFWLVSAR
jgi:hypothetical protein